MDRIVVVGGCSEACEEGCLRSVELSNGLEGFKISSVELREPRRSPALFRGASKGSALVIGGCSGPGRHVASADLLSVDGSVAGEGLESLGYEFSCAAFCTLPTGERFLAGGYNGRECMDQVSLVHPHKSLRPLLSRLKNSAAVPGMRDGSVLLFGGWDQARTTSAIFEYAVPREECSVRGVLPYAIEGHTATRVGSNTFLCGGFDGVGVVATITRFDLDEGRSEVLPDVKLAIPRENHAVVLVENEKFLVIVGGWDGQRALKDCEIFEVLSQAPWLLPAKDRKLELCAARNRPAAICL